MIEVYTKPDCPQCEMTLDVSDSPSYQDPEYQCRRKPGMRKACATRAIARYRLW